MSMYEISNGELTVCVDSKGAEIKSVKAGDREYMWNGDPKFWGRTSPVLFPVVGSLKNKQFTVDGKVYQMGQHGFARDTEFALMSQSKDMITFVLEASDETLEKFPYDFRLEISYRLEGKAVVVGWKVTTKSELDFSIGAHPAFLCNQEGYSFHIYGAEELVYQKLNSDGTLNRELYDMGLVDGILPITQELFAEDALIVSNSDVTKIAIADENDTEYLAVEFDAPLFGLWSPAGKNAPFVCIEPWYGRCDADDFDGEWKDREHSNHISADEAFEKSYRIVIL